MTPRLQWSNLIVEPGRSLSIKTRYIFQNMGQVKGAMDDFAHINKHFCMQNFYLFAKMWKKLVIYNHQQEDRLSSYYLDSYSYVSNVIQQFSMLKLIYVHIYTYITITIKLCPLFGDGFMDPHSPSIYLGQPLTLSFSISFLPKKSRNSKCYFFSICLISNLEPLSIHLYLHLSYLFAYQ